MKRTANNPVELRDAQQRIKRWQLYIGSNFETKAFFISLDDIKTLYDEILASNGIGVRAYLARTSEEQNEILLVGVQQSSYSSQGKDIIEENGSSRIYDLTTPCPNMCDVESPLFNLP